MIQFYEDVCARIKEESQKTELPIIETATKAVVMPGLNIGYLVCLSHCSRCFPQSRRYLQKA